MIYNKTTTIVLALCCWAFGLLAQTQPTATPYVQVRFSKVGGFFKGNVDVSLEANGAPIFFTTDGSRPTTKSKLYTQTLRLHRTTVLRATALLEKKWLSPTVTQSYLINEDVSNMPVVSVAIDPNILTGEKYGIMNAGPKADLSKHNQPGANFWTKREFSCNTEIFETDGSLVHNSGTGFRIFGGYSRIFPQKSIVLVARKRYGAKRFKHEFFGDDGLKKFKYLVLRNGGSDWNGTHFRDGLMSELTHDWDAEQQGFRPAIVFLNGEYWGIYNIREKINTRFLADHCDLARDSIDLLEHKNTVRQGSYQHYGALLGFLERSDIRNPNVYAEVNRRIDMKNFMDMQIAQIYCDNSDAGGNVRYWRPQRQNGRWRWILFDMDWGFGLHRKKAYTYNSLDFFTDPNGPDWPNPPWSTQMLRTLLKNDQFKNDFVNRFCDRLNMELGAKNAEKVLNSLYTTYKPAMRRQFQRWNQSPADWEYAVNTVREFVVHRPDYMHHFLTDKFNLGGLCELQVACSAGGKVMINDLVEVGETGFSGEYFEKTPVNLRVTANFGYRFAGWEGVGGDRTNDFISVHLREGKILRLRARFERYDHPLSDQVIINEVCAFNKYTGDWIELYNKTGQTIDLSRWIFSDGKNRFRLPKASIPSKGYLVLCEDSVEFRKVYKPERVPNLVGSFGFGLNKALEHLTLFADDGGSIDSVFYLTEPLETAFTLDLIYPSLNNDKHSSWHLQAGNGSPGLHNPIYFAEIVGAEKDFWMQIGLGISFFLILFLFLFWKRRA